MDTHRNYAMTDVGMKAATVRLLRRKLPVLLLAALLVAPLQTLRAASDDEQVESSVAPVPASRPPVSDKKARRELQDLLDKGVGALAPELVAQGTFYPFAAVLGHDDEVRLVGVPAAERKADPEAALNALVARIQVLATERRIRGAAFFVDVMAQRHDTGFPQAGIRVELNHRHPDALSVFIPYSITNDKKLRLLTPQYRPGKNLTFESK
jgi:hypothetical protein